MDDIDEDTLQLSFEVQVTDHIENVADVRRDFTATVSYSNSRTESATDGLLVGEDGLEKPELQLMAHLDPEFNATTIEKG